MKNMKMYTKLLIGYLLIIVVYMISLVVGYNSVAKMMNLEEGARRTFLSQYATQTAVLFIAMIVCVGGIMWMMLKTIRKGMKGLTDVADGLAAGKVDIKAEKEGNDEFGILMDDFQKVIENTRSNAEVAQAVADGDMTVQVVPKSEEDALGVALKKMVDSNLYTLSSIREAANQVSVSSAQVASASEALAQGSTEQASAIEQVTVSIDDVAERTRQNAQQANAAADMMAKAIIDVKRGNAEMQEMMKAMDAINTASESISKIIKVIDDIAFQTNILALNAAVEAARAGEAGMGFAVVAEEVRNLAAKSASAAAETAEMIEDSIKKVAIGSKIASDTAVALDKITAIVSESENIVNEIARASNDQATAIAQIDQAVEQVSQVVQNNSATSEECAAASVELSNQAGKVKELVSTYKLGEETTSTSVDYFAFTTDNSEQTAFFGEGFGKY